MHEFSLMADLLRKIEFVALQEGAPKVSGVKVRLGALCQISAEHFHDHFTSASRGTVAEGAELAIEVATDAADPRAQDIYVESLTLEE
jgi:hydrogenase nickel incorporation protein HypA/HybF